MCHLVKFKLSSPHDRINEMPNTALKTLTYDSLAASAGLVLDIFRSDAVNMLHCCNGRSRSHSSGLTRTQKSRFLRYRRRHLRDWRTSLWTTVVLEQPHRHVIFTCVSDQVVSATVGTMLTYFTDSIIDRGENFVSVLTYIDRSINNFSSLFTRQRLKQRSKQNIECERTGVSGTTDSTSSSKRIWGCLENTP
jgi:hypothetical protein